ncbi:MAG: FAD-dependent monooxygenase [Pseudomonadota bacterium]
MSLKNMQITVIGAGIGGLAVSQALALRGARVRVLEQADAIREVGAGIQISPNGARVFEALGLSEQLRDVGLQAQAVQLVDYKGAGVTRLDLSRLANQDYYFVHRADLIDLLAGAARAAGVEIVLNAKVEALHLDKTPMLRLKDGTEMKPDLVIGADGLHSVARQSICGSLAPFFTGQTAWRATLPNVSGRAPEARVHMGPKRHVVSYPLRDGALLNLVAVQERDTWIEESWSQEDNPDTLRAAFADFCPEVQEMLAAVERVHLWGLFRHPVAPEWHRGGAVLLGDAAHPMLPFLAQGASMALEDAWVLCDALNLPGSLQTRLAAYQTRRRDRVVRVTDAASGNAWKYHLSFPPLRWAAHQAIRIGGALMPDRMMGQFNWLYEHDVRA